MDKQQVYKQIESMQTELGKLKDEVARLQQQPVATRWKPEIGQKYWYIDTGGVLCSCTCYNDPEDERRYNFGNVFETRELAQQHSDRIKLMTRLGDAALQCGGGKGEWEIEYHYVKEKLEVCKYMAIRSTFKQYRFQIEEDARRFIELAGDDYMRLLI